MTDPRTATVDILTDLKAQARAGADVLDRILRTADALQAALAQGVQGPFEAALNACSTDMQRRVQRGKIEADPSLEAFICARIKTATFTVIAADIAANFPPAQRVGVSSIHRWWHRRGKLLGASTIANNQL